MLFACASAPLQRNGPILQSGPADAPLYETTLESAETCEMFLRSFNSAARQSSRCASTLSGLAYGYDISLELGGKARVNASTLAGCERSRINALAKDHMKVRTKCEKNGEPGKK